MVKSPNRGRWISRAIVASLLVALVAQEPLSSALAQERPTVKVAAQGDLAPGTNGQKFTDFDNPSTNRNGQYSFEANYGSEGDDDCDGQGVFLRTESGLSPVLLSGQDTKAGRVPEAYGECEAWAFGSRSLTNKGTVGIAAYDLESPNGYSAGLFQKPLNKPLRVVAKTGDNAPGGGRLLDFDTISQNNSDAAAFEALVGNRGSEWTRIFYAKPGKGLKIILKEGDLLPGTGGGVFCSDAPVGGPYINDDGVVAFEIGGWQICGGDYSGDGNFLGLFYRTSPGAPLQVAIKTGDDAPYPGFGSDFQVEWMEIGRRGLNNEEFGVRLWVDDGSYEVEMLAYVSLDGDTEICAVEAEDVTEAGARASAVRGNQVVKINGDKNREAPSWPSETKNGSSNVKPQHHGAYGDFEGPVINEAGVIAFLGEMYTEEDGYTDGVFACDRGHIYDVALDGDSKPGSAGDFEDLEDVNLGDTNNGRFHVVFRDDDEREGVYAARVTRVSN